MVAAKGKFTHTATFIILKIQTLINECTLLIYGDVQKSSDFLSSSLFKSDDNIVNRM